MAGNDHIPTAPKDVIGDDGDLRQMRDALRAGKHVTLASDGKVYVSNEAKTPMTSDQEAFIESKLGHVIEMAREGYGVSVHPDGTISADRADHRAKAMYDMDAGFGEQERLLIQRGVQDGALVRLHTDGHVEYFLPKDAKPPSPAEAAKLQAFLDEEIASGRLADAWRNGETLAAQPDGSVVYQHVADGPAAVEFPEDVGVDTPPPTTADRLEEEAQGLELGAGAARRITLDEYEADAGEATRLRDAAARQKATAEAAAKVADAQFDEKQTVAARIAAEQVEVAKRAEEYRDAGDLERAEEMAEKWARLNVEHRIAEQEVVAAKSAADASRADVAKHAADEATYEGRVRESWTERTRNEEAQDNQEDQARAYRRAATEMREAERLDAAYTDLEARGVDGAERVKEAADQARRRAEAIRTEAESYDKQPEWATSPDDPAPTRPIRPNPGVFGDDLSDVSSTGAADDPLGADTALAAAATSTTDDTGVFVDGEMDTSAASFGSDNLVASELSSFGSDGIEIEAESTAEFADDRASDFDDAALVPTMNDVDLAGGFGPADDFAAADVGSDFADGSTDASPDGGFGDGSFGETFEG